jgi:hypothetical protein
MQIMTGWTCPWQSPKNDGRGPQELTHRRHTVLRGGQRNSCYRVNSPRIAGPDNPNSACQNFNCAILWSSKLQ